MGKLQSKRVVLKPKPTFQREKELRESGYVVIAGTDEAGLGPLAGPAVASAVIFDESVTFIKGLTDSKLLTPEQREDLYPIIIEKALSYGISIVSVETINEINIYWAGRQGMLEAIAQLNPQPDYILIDGNKPLKTFISQESIVKGDQKSLSIAAASVLAKVTRDKIMCELALEYPEYMWQQNKGYPCPLHKEVIRELGITPHHRLSFKGVREFRDNYNDSVVDRV
jgi:ribonuclease HII